MTYETSDAGNVHIIPISARTGKEAALPITKGRAPADRVVVQEMEGAEGAADEIEYLLSELIGLPTEREKVGDGTHDQVSALDDQAREVLEGGGHVWLNASADGHAPTLVASTLAIERPSDRPRIHLYRGLDEDYEELAIAPDPSVPDFAFDLLDHIASNGDSESVSQLAKDVYDGEGLPESFRSKAQYNVQQLEEAGFVTRQERGNRMQPRLTSMGELWVSIRE